MEALDIGAVVLCMLAFVSIYVMKLMSPQSVLIDIYGPPLLIAGFIFLIFSDIPHSAKPNHTPRTMRAVVQEAAAFHHRPPVIAADWRRLQAGHRLTYAQWATFKNWVEHKREARGRRFVERIVTNPASVRAHKPAVNRQPSHADGKVH